MTLTLLGLLAAAGCGQQASQSSQGLERSAEKTSDGIAEELTNAGAASPGDGQVGCRTASADPLETATPTYNPAGPASPGAIDARGSSLVIVNMDGGPPVTLSGQARPVEAPSSSLSACGLPVMVRPGYWPAGAGRRTRPCRAGANRLAHGPRSVTNVHTCRAGAGIVTRVVEF